MNFGFFSAHNTIFVWQRLLCFGGLLAQPTVSIVFFHSSVPRCCLCVISIDSPCRRLFCSCCCWLLTAWLWIDGTRNYETRRAKLIIIDSRIIRRAAKMLRMNELSMDRINQNGKCILHRFFPSKLRQILSENSQKLQKLTAIVWMVASIWGIARTHLIMCVEYKSTVECFIDALAHLLAQMLRASHACHWHCLAQRTQTFQRNALASMRSVNV